MSSQLSGMNSFYANYDHTISISSLPIAIDITNIYNSNTIIIMQVPVPNKIKFKPINLNHTSETISMAQLTHQQSLQRYRRSSLPNSIGHYSINVRHSVEQPSTDIYFNQHKKAKFMKQIVDNYFEDTLQKIYGNEKANQSRELQTLQKNERNVRNINKRNKVLHSISEDYAQKKSPPKLKKTTSLEQQVEQHQNELYLSINSNTTGMSSFLPPIYQSHEDVEDIGKVFSEMADVHHQITLKNTDSSERRLTFENQAFRIYAVGQNGHNQYRIKQFKSSGMEILKREQRALKFGVEGIWKQSQLSANSFVSNVVHPLKNLIYKISPHHEGKVKYKIRSTSYRKYLLANSCQQLKHVLRELCAILKKIQGRVLNNKINPSNIFVLKGNAICVGQWGYSSFRDEYQIQANKFESRINPILKSSKEWLATPEYLSPEMLQAVLAKTDAEQPDIWEYKSSSDIWSLGITLFQVLTMIPIWMADICYCKSKTKRPIVRAGLLGTEDRNLTKIAQKQKKIQRYLAISIENEIEEGIPKQIVDLVSKMVVVDPAKRITLDEIISIIK